MATTHTKTQNAKTLSTSMPPTRTEPVPLDSLALSILSSVRQSFYRQTEKKELNYNSQATMDASGESLGEPSGDTMRDNLRERIRENMAENGVGLAANAPAKTGNVSTTPNILGLPSVGLPSTGLNSNSAMKAGQRSAGSVDSEQTQNETKNELKPIQKLRGSVLLEHLLMVSRHMAEMRDLEPLLAYAIDQVMQLVGAEHGYIVLLEPDGSLDYKVKRHQDGSDIHDSTDMVSHSILNKVVESKQSLIVRNAMADPQYAQADSVMQMRLRSIMCTPLITQNRIIGAIYVENRSVSGRFSKEDLAPLEFFSNQAAVSIENANFYNHLEHLVVERTKDLIEAKETAEKARQAAETANQAKSRFLSNMSHELRTPLNAILGFTQLLKLDDNLEDDQLESLEIMNQSGEHLLTLIDEVLDLAKIEAEKLDLQPAMCNLPKLLEVVVGLLRLQSEEKGLRFKCEIAKDIPIQIFVDEARLRQVLVNLLTNAVKFTDSGQVLLRVQRLDVSHFTPNKFHGGQTGTVVQTHDETATLRFEVSDTGVGMTQEELTKIFLPFEQVGDTKLHHAGTGLGLAITHKLVQLLGGELYVKSEKGLGSTFEFTLELPTHG
ncbi:MAG: ATP-binding protein [Chloroflexota bacterium]